MQELLRTKIKYGCDPELVPVKYALLIKESLDLNAVDPNGAFPMYIYGAIGSSIANAEIAMLNNTFWYVLTHDLYQNNMLFKTQKRIVLYNHGLSFNTMKGLLLDHQDPLSHLPGRHFGTRGEVFA